MSASRPCTSGSSGIKFENAPHAHGFFAELGPHPILAGRGRVALVEDEIEHAQHRGHPLRALLATRHFEGHAGLGNGALGAHDALPDGRVIGEEGPRDFLGRQPANEPQRQRHPAFGWQHRMAGGKDQPQQVIADIVVQLLMQGGLGIRHLLLHVAADGFELARRHFSVPEIVDGLALARLHQPGAGIAGHAGFRPGSERGHERFLGQFLGEGNVPHHAREAGNQPRLFEAPDGRDGPVGFPPPLC
jgi:hypothetical protein